MIGKFGIFLGENLKGGKEFYEIKKMVVFFNFFYVIFGEF